MGKRKDLSLWVVEAVVSRGSGNETIEAVRLSGCLVDECREITDIFKL